VSKERFKNNDVDQIVFGESYIFGWKNHSPLKFVKNVWLKHLILHLCPWVWFSSQKFFSHDVLPHLMEKTKWTYVLRLLEECHFATISFDLWISKGAHNVFALINFF
jgi:hypothetical protein